MRTCEIVENGERCGRKVKCKGMCGKHYQRVEKYGDPLVVKSVREKREHEKWCSGCEEWLPKENFFSNKSAAQGLAKICKPCMKAARILSKYGITQDQFLAMLERHTQPPSRAARAPGTSTTIMAAAPARRPAASASEPCCACPATWVLATSGTTPIACYRPLSTSSGTGI